MANILKSTTPTHNHEFVGAGFTKYFYSAAFETLNVSVGEEDSSTRWELVQDSLNSLCRNGKNNLHAFVNGEVGNRIMAFFIFNKETSVNEARQKLNLPFGHFSERMGTGLDEYNTILRLCGKGCKQEGFLCNHEPLFTRFVFEYNHTNTSCELEGEFLNDIITAIHDSNDVKNYVARHCRGAMSFENNLHVYFETRVPMTLLPLP